MSTPRELVQLEQIASVAVLRLNNPQQYNSLADGMAQQLLSRLEAVEQDSRIGAIVLTGNGKGFCAGANLAGEELLQVRPVIGERLREHMNPIIRKMRACAKPIVCAINGPAAGAGVGIALAADIVLAARSAQFVLSFAKVGAVLDAGTSVLVQRSVGAARARALALLAEPLTADDALEAGLVWRVAEDALLMEEALGVARRLAEGPALALALIKQQLNAGWSALLDEALEFEAASQMRAFASEDVVEGVKAFQERRSPRFTSKAAE